MTWMSVLFKIALGFVAWQIADRTRSVVVNLLAVLWLAIWGDIMLGMQFLAGFSLPMTVGGVVMVGLAWHAWRHGPTPEW
jgi:hypothetical protein